MKKKVTAFVLAIIMMFGISGTALASEGQVRASPYLESYYVALFAKGNGKMAVAVSVNGVEKEDVIGMLEVYIEQKIDGKWHYYDSLVSVEYPEFMERNTVTYLHTIYFQGTPGDTYRVTITVYAEKDGGSDTGYVTSSSEVCL